MNLETAILLMVSIIELLFGVWFFWTVDRILKARREKRG
jgi:hypothetical protein